MQGFVSNKDSDTTGERGDPIEGLLYATFVASTERADVASLVRSQAPSPEAIQITISDNDTSTVIAT